MKNKNIKKKIIILSIIFLCIFNICKSCFGTEEIEEIRKKEIIGECGTEDIFEEIEAPNLILAETNSQRILYGRNTKDKIYPASITKLLTAILVVENCELDETVTVSENAVKSVPYGYVNANLQIGEELTVEDLLYAMLIPSANDVANALAEHVGGSIESFSAMMNTRAKELGCTNSNFTNPSGLHEENHYTTTEDLLLIAKEAISKSTIKKILGTSTYSLPQTNKYDKTQRIFTTTNYMKRKSLTNYYYEYCIGGKTGYTGEAKNCVVEFAENDGIELIAIVMGENSKIKGQKFLDARKMFDYAFENYVIKKVSEKDNEATTLEINNATKETKKLKVLYKNDINILVTKNDENIEEQTEYAKVKAPIQKGEIVGKKTYSYNGIKYTADLIAGSNVEESKVFNIIIKILLIILIIYIIYIFKKSNKNIGNHGKK